MLCTIELTHGTQTDNLDQDRARNPDPRVDQTVLPDLGPGQDPVLQRDQNPAAAQLNQVTHTNHSAMEGLKQPL